MLKSCNFAHSMMTQSNKSILTGAVAISIAAILWGLDGVILTPQLYNLEVSFVVFILHAIPFLLMNVFFFKEYRYLNQFTKIDFTTLFLVSLFGGAIGTIAIVKALFLVNFQQLTVVVLLQKLQPIFAIALAAIILKERLQRSFILWASIAIIAGYFMTFGWRLPNFTTGSNTIYASLLAVLAAFSFGSSTVFSKKVLQKYNFKTATFYRYGMTTMIMMTIVFIGGNFNQFAVSTTDNWIYFVLIALTTGSGAIVLYYYGLNKVKAIIATICELFFPISAIILDYFVHGTRLSPVQWISAAIMIFAIISLNRSNAKNKK